MSSARTRKTVLVLTAVSALFGCRDANVSGPATPELPSVISYRLASDERLRLLSRHKAQPETQSVTRRLDARGGVISVGGATLIVPAGALAEPVEITLTVPEGDDFRAEFAPHGLQFRKPALLGFNVSGSGVDARQAAEQLIGAYFTGELADGRIVTRELNPAFQYGRLAAFQIWHFCSYGLAPRKGLILVGG